MKTQFERFEIERFETRITCVTRPPQILQIKKRAVSDIFFEIIGRKLVCVIGKICIFVAAKRYDYLNQNELNNMKKPILLILIMLSAVNVYSFGVENSNGSIDTVYYDSEWRLAPMMQFATYRRVIFTSSDTTKFKNMYRDYYTDSGTLQGEGGFVSIDRGDVSKSVYDGKCVTYYKNGNVKERQVFTHGILNGEYASFFENGYLEKQCIYKNGLMDGLCNIFDKDRKYCTQIEYSNGEHAQPYYSVSNQEGLRSRYRIDDNQPYFEEATPEDVEELDEDGVYSICKNGVMVSLIAGKWTFYGNYLQLRMNISNFTLDPISFNPNKITVKYSQNGKVKKVNDDSDDLYSNTIRTSRRKSSTSSGGSIFHPMTADEYASKIKKKQNVLMGLYAVSSAMANAGQGYSNTTITSTTNYSGDATMVGGAYAYGSNGSALAYFGGKIESNSTTNTTTNIRTYDPYVAYQAQLITEQRMQQFRYGFNQQVEEAYEGYMTPTKIPSAQTACGHVNVTYVGRADEVTITIYINDTPYTFYLEK